MSDATFVDERDGRVYKTVKIGNQVWMAENLNYEAEGSVCYGEDGVVMWLDEDDIPVEKTFSPDELEANRETYGRLYDWETAKEACPAGWHLPTDGEWAALTNFIGGAGTAGEKLKSSRGWDDDGNGSDEYGFSALPGGYSLECLFDDCGRYGYWWSATEVDAENALGWLVGSEGDSVARSGFPKTYLYSVRCVAD